MTERGESRGRDETFDVPVEDRAGRYDSVKIPASSRFLGRAFAVVKSSIMHPLKTTIIEQTEDLKAGNP